jgi:hypothetical protein
MNTFGLGLLGHYFYPSRVHTYTLPAHYKSQKLNLHLEERAFLKIGIKAELPEPFKDFLDVSPIIL